jgi:O-antigen ligase
MPILLSLAARITNFRSQRVQSSSQASNLPSSPQPSTGYSASRHSASKADLLDGWCEKAILALVLAALVLGPLAFGAVEAPSILILQALTVGTGFLWLVRSWLTRSYRILVPPVCWAVCLFIGYAVFRYQMVVREGGIEYLARQELILVLMYGFLFFAVLNNLSRQESVQAVSMTLFGLGTIISLYAVYQFLTKSTHVLWVAQYAGYIGRGSGTYMCPNHLAGLLEMIMPLALAFTLTGRFKPTAKVFLGYAALAVFAGIGVSLSRGGWLSTALALLLFFALLLRKRGQRLVAILFLILLLGGFVFFVKNVGAWQRRVHVVLTENKGGQDSRFELWRPAYQMWRDHFWWGVGPAHFDQAFRKYRPDDIQMRPLYVHNDYLNTLADWGVVGLGLIAITILLLYAGVIQSWKYVQRSNDLAAKRSNRSAFVLGAAVAVLAMLLHSAVDFNMHIPANAMVAVTLMALLAGHVRFATERYWLKLGWFGKPILTCVGLAGLVYLAQQTGQAGHAYVLLDRANRAKALSAKLNSLKAAWAVEPQNPETTYQLGETLRLASWEGVGNYRDLASEALTWFQRGMKLNPYDPYNYLRYGMCLHWLDRSNEAAPYFQKALDLDPKSYFMMCHMGWHYLQLDDLPKAKLWFEKAVFQAHWHPQYRFTRYQTGLFYLNLVEQRLREKSGKP